MKQYNNNWVSGSRENEPIYLFSEGPYSRDDTMSVTFFMF